MHYIFTVQGPSGVTFEVFERYSDIEQWYKKMAKGLKDHLKKSKEKPPSLPSIPTTSMSDKLAEMKRKESFYQKRGEALAAFFNQLGAVPVISRSEQMMWFCYFRAMDEVSKDRVA